VPFEKVEGLLQPYTPLEWEKVSRVVNKVGNDTPDCIVPIGNGLDPASSGSSKAAGSASIQSFFAKAKSTEVKQDVESGRPDEKDDHPDEEDGKPDEWEHPNDDKHSVKTEPGKVLLAFPFSVYPLFL
jgi:uncharacterized cupredoxin-like copper-binding protein